MLNRFNQASLRCTAFDYLLLLFWNLQKFIILLIKFRGLTSLARLGSSSAMDILEASLRHHGWQTKRDVKIAIPLRIRFTIEVLLEADHLSPHALPGV